jgi:predicted ester cyclase
MVQSNEIPSVIRDYVDALNAGDFPKLMSLFTADARIVGVLGAAPVDKAEPVWRELHDGMAMHLEPQAIAVDGATIAVRYIETGQFRGTFRGLEGQAPTGRAYRVIAMEWFELEGHRIAKRWGARDFDAIKSQVLGSD